MAGAAALTILEAAGVAGALLTGTLSDRWGRRRMLLSLLCAAPVLMLFFLFGPKALALPLLIALGLTAISPTPVMMAIVQDQFPDHRAAANGVYMFINFVAGAGFAGWSALADCYGLTVLLPLCWPCLRRSRCASDAARRLGAVVTQSEKSQPAWLTDAALCAIITTALPSLAGRRASTGFFALPPI